MNKSYIEALQRLFGDEWEVDDTDCYKRKDGCRIEYYDYTKDSPRLCHLIDEKLLERDRARIDIELTKGRCRFWFIDGESYAGDGPDPLTARLEALVKLKESND